MFVFYLVIWALIHTNHFCYLDLTKLKAYSTPIWILISFINLGVVLSKSIDKIRSWRKFLRQNRKSVFQRKKSSSPKLIFFVKFQAFDKKCWSDSTLIHENKGENFLFERVTYSFNLLWFSRFSQLTMICLTMTLGFALDCRQYTDDYLSGTKTKTSLTLRLDFNLFCRIPRS